MCSYFIRIEVYVPRGGDFGQFQHELKRLDRFATIDVRPAVSVEHLGPKGPEERHEIGYDRVPLRRPHYVAVHLLPAADCFPVPVDLVPGSWSGQAVLLKQIPAVEEELGVAHVRKRILRSISVGVAAQGHGRPDEILVGSRQAFLSEQRRQIQKAAHLRKTRKPRVVDHHEIVIGRRAA